MIRKLNFISAISAFSFLASGTAFAQEESFAERIDLRTQFTVQFINEDDRDLGIAGADPDSSLSEQLQVSARPRLSDNVSAFVNARFLNIDGDTGFDDDTGQSITNAQTFFELRELFLRFENVGGNTPLSIQAGRQRVREPRSLWWNNDFDMLKVSYDTTLLTSFFAIGENLTSYRTSNDDDYREEDEDRFRTLGEVSWQYRYNHFLEGRFIYEDDHSGTEQVGAIIDANNRDNEDQNAVWVGIRGVGTVAPTSTNGNTLKYRADLLGVIGETDEITSVAGPGATERTVTGVDNSDLRAWAFDGEVAVDTNLPLKPNFSFGYAYGSGDDDAADDTSHEFRQSDLHGGSSRRGFGRQNQRNYGEVLRPELSNLHILSAGVGIPVTDATDASLTYFNYHLAEDATSLRSSGITAPLNGTDNDLGQAVDFVVNVDIDQEFQTNTSFIKDVNVRFIAGTFVPGDAFDPAGNDNAYRLFTELKLRF